MSRWRSAARYSRHCSSRKSCWLRNSWPSCPVKPSALTLTSVSRTPRPWPTWSAVSTALRGSLKSTGRNPDMGTRPSVLRTSFHEKVWGSQRLAPWFPNPPRKIGEVWHEMQNPLPILVKFLFTSDRLSVQVHPGDEYAALHESARGKTEMWHVLRADAGAAVALGLREPVSPE